MAIDRTAFDALVDDDGSNLTGSPWDKAAIADVLLDPIDDALATAGGAVGVSTITTTGNITALALPSGGGDLLIRLNNASLTTIQGIAAGLSGQRLTIQSVGAGQVDLMHQHASATAANRLITRVTSGVTSLAAGSGSADVLYDATTARWRLVAHEQGAAIAVPYTAGDYTAAGAMTWTGNASFAEYSYYLTGRTLTITLLLDAGTIGGTVNVQVQLKLPGTMTVFSGASNLCFLKDNGVKVTGRLSVSAAGTNINIGRLDQANFTLQTGTLQIIGEIVLFVT